MLALTSVHSIPLHCVAYFFLFFCSQHRLLSSLRDHMFGFSLRHYFGISCLCAKYMLQYAFTSMLKSVFAVSSSRLLQTFGLMAPMGMGHCGRQRGNYHTHAELLSCQYFFCHTTIQLCSELDTRAHRAQTAQGSDMLYLFIEFALCIEKHV